MHVNVSPKLYAITDALVPEPQVADNSLRYLSQDECLPVTGRVPTCHRALHVDLELHGLRAALDVCGVPAVVVQTVTHRQDL